MSSSVELFSFGYYLRWQGESLTHHRRILIGLWFVCRLESTRLLVVDSKLVVLHAGCRKSPWTAALVFRYGRLTLMKLQSSSVVKSDQRCIGVRISTYTRAPPAQHLPRSYSDSPVGLPIDLILMIIDVAVRAC
jgi:hypothetical protein